MSYNNYNNNNRGNYQPRYNNGGGNYQPRQNSYRNQNQPIKKQSGCKVKLVAPQFDKAVTERCFGDGALMPVVHGWKKDKTNGFRTFYARPYSGGKSGKGSNRYKSKTGKEWVNVIVTQTWPGAKSTLHSGLLEVGTNRVIIQELGIIMNPNKDYTGPNYRRKN